MVYLPTIPAANDKPAQSQPQIQTNFTELNTQFSTEHIAFDSAINNGQHKFVTLKRSAGVPPVGTDMVMAQALTVAGNPYLQALNSTTIFSIPLVYTNPVAINIPAGTGVRNILNFAGLGFLPQAGTILLYDNNQPGRMVFSPFVYKAGTLSIPVGSAQLATGTTFRKMDSAGAVLQLEVNSYPVGGTTVFVRVIGTAL